MGSKLNHAQQLQKEKDRKFKEMYSGFGNGMTFEDFSSGGKSKYKVEFGYGKVNPNDSFAFRGKSRR